MIFLDVGAHEGQTLEEVSRPAYGFERIYAFEPMAEQFRVLEARFGADPRVRLLEYGLAGSSGTRDVYGGNREMEASIYPEKADVDAARVTRCRFMRASEFVASLPRLEGSAAPGAELAGPVILKLNCEGAEVEILDDLIDANLLGRLAHAMIDFDVRKVPGREAEAERVLARLAAAGFDRYSLAEDVMVGATHQERTAAWLARIGLP